MSENKRLDLYQQELGNAILAIKNKLAECQTAIGVLESFLYMIRKEAEMATPPEVK